MNPVLEARQLTRRYLQGESEIVALRNFSQRFEVGQVTAIVGPSGSGKTTLLNLLAGFDLPSEGEVLLKTQERTVSLSRLSEEERADLRLHTMGFVFQQWNLLPTLSAWENVAFPMMLAGVSYRERRARAQALIEAVGLPHRAHHLPSRLSGGEQQRVALARALALDPLFLFADEPTGNLDSASGSQVMDLLLRQAERERGVILVTHDLQLARMAHRLLYLRDGQLTGEEESKRLNPR